MSTTPNQNLRVVGSLEVFTEQNATTDRGQIRFSGPFGADYGKMKAVGFGGFGNLMLDCANLQGGLVIRTAAAQDSGVIGQAPPFQPYSLQVITNNLGGPGCKTPSLFIDATDSNFGDKLGTTIFRVARGNTSAVLPVTSLQSVISSFTQNTFRAGESIVTSIGFGTTFGAGGMGYYTPTGSSSDANNRLFFGMYNSPTSQFPRSLQITPAGNVEIPLQLTTGTVFATTYLNLPPPTAASLLPLTLDKINNRVGINNLTPTETLDVIGTLSISGSSYLQDIFSSNLDVLSDITTNTITATTYFNLPPPTAADLLPLTLDKINNRVGINNVSPTRTLDVIGSLSVSTTSFLNNVIANDIETIDFLTGRARVNNCTIYSANGSPEGVVTANVGSLFMRSDGTYNSALYLKEEGVGNTGWEPVTTRHNFRPKQFPGTYLTPCSNATMLSTTGAITNQLQLIPFSVNFTYTIDQVSWVITTANANGRFDFAIYGSDKNGTPTGDPIWSVLNQLTSPVGTTNLPVSIVLPANTFFWLGFRRNIFNQPRWRAFDPSTLLPLNVVNTFQDLACILRITSVQNTPFPTLTPALIATGTYVQDSQPALFLRVA
jgi:hypothetical protein